MKNVKNYHIVVKPLPRIVSAIFGSLRASSWMGQRSVHLLKSGMVQNVHIKTNGSIASFKLLLFINGR